MISITKTQPEPDCLAVERGKANGNYACGSVIATNKHDFHNKCYICGFKEPTSINTEHFIPHRNDHTLKFDWNNLFYACVHCNSTKSDNPVFDNILNCTNAAHDVEGSIKSVIKPLPREQAIFMPLRDADEVRNTVSLLQAVFNGTTTLKVIEAANLRNHLLKEIRAFQELLISYDDDQNTDDEKTEYRTKILKQIRLSSNFAAFKRWIIRDSAFFFGEFGAFL